MALYIGNSEKLKISLGEYLTCLNIGLPIIPNNVLLSSDNYMLKDSNEVYLISKESE